MLHAKLGAVGKTVVYTNEPEGDRGDAAAALAELVRDMDAGSVEWLVVLGGNLALAGDGLSADGDLQIDLVGLNPLWE